MRKFYFIVSLILYSNIGVAQRIIILKGAPSLVTADSIKSGKRWDIEVDLASRYIWRGQSWGGNYAVVQPSFNYGITKKLSVGIWATTNFQKDYFENDGIKQKSYHEFDIGLSYQLTSFLSIQVWDYYWPALQQMKSVNTNYFNYGADGVKTVDATAVFDFSEGYKLAFDGTISTLIGGNDYRYNSDGTTLKRNYTTYLQLGYQFPDIFAVFSTKFLEKIDAHPVVGAVINNEAEYYTYADYTKPSLVNIALSLTRKFQINDYITIPVTLSYIRNAATANTELYGKNFLIGGISFWY